jgi:hypothetical protein
VSNLAQTVTYQLLDITLDQTLAPQLDYTFAANLSPSATRVLSLSPNSTITYQGRTWTPIPFTTLFPYDGMSNLVIEFRKAVPPGGIDTYMVVASDPRRYDLPRHLNALGPCAAGTGASQATVAANHVHMVASCGRRMAVQ